MKKLASILVFLVFISFTAFGQFTSDVCPDLKVSNNPNTVFAMWDMQFNWDVGTAPRANGNAGVVYIPTLDKIWVSKWSTVPSILVFNHNGTYADSFNLAVAGTRGMTYDGQYIYCSQNSATVQKVDPATRAIVGTVTLAAGVPNGARYIAFDPTADGGNGGFWVGNWTAPNLNFYLVKKDGSAILNTITNATTGVYGLGFDNVTSGGPYLWVFSQGAGAGTPQYISQLKISTGLYTGVQHDVAPDAGGAIISGGITVTNKYNTAKQLLLACCQGSTTVAPLINDRVVGYELSQIIPVELTSFTASTGSNSVTLKWSTATETNNRGFEIQRRSANGDYVTVAFVDGKGTTTATQNYSFTDKNLVAGAYSYRLKQVDYNGWYKISKSVETEIATVNNYALIQNYPNPFNPNTTISFTLAVDSKVTLRVYNLLGQELSVLVNGNLSAGSHSVKFDGANVTSGMYIYRIDASGNNGSNFTSIRKMILNK